MPKMKLGDVAIEFKDKCNGNGAGLPSVGLEHLVPGEVRLSNWEDNAQNTFTKLFKKGHILFGRRRAYQKKASVAEFEGKCSGDITVIEAKEGVIKKDLLPFIIQNDEFFDFAVSKSAGSLSPRVKWSHLKEYEFSLPDREEQDKLAELLWAIEENIEAYNNLNLATEELIKGKFIKMFGSPLGKESKYKRVKLKKLCDKASSNISIKKVEHDIGDYPLYGASGLIKYISSYKMELPYIGIVKDGAGVGRTFKLPAKSSVVSTIQYILPKPETNISYLEYLIKFMDLGKGYTGSAIPHIYFKDYGEIYVPAPPIEIQKQFEKIACEAEKSIQHTNKCIDNLQLVKKAIVKKYFG